MQADEVRGGDSWRIDRSDEWTAVILTRHSARQFEIRVCNSLRRAMHMNNAGDCCDTAVAHCASERSTADGARSSRAERYGRMCADHTARGTESTQFITMVMTDGGLADKDEEAALTSTLAVVDAATARRASVSAPAAVPPFGITIASARTLRLIQSN
jgi:hypothetical protein